MTATASLVFGLALALGLAGAFVGLSTSSYWFDELFTKWVIGADDASLFLARALSDAHPPTYYALAFAWSLIAGSSDAATRLLSAVCAVSAVGAFVWRMPASMNARLFAGALATSSIFWFYQSQNARSYALGLLLLILVFFRCMTDLEDRKSASANRPVVTTALLELASMTHLYIFFACVAALLMMFALKRRLRVQYSAVGAFLFATAGVYYLVVIPRYSQFTVGKTWIPGDASWFVGQGIDAIKQTYGVFGLLALALCAIALANPEARRGISGERRLDGLLRWARTETVTVFCFGVPLLTLAAGVATSVITPTFTTRNFLVVSPFLWGLTARIYDLSLSRTGPRLALVLTGIAAVLTTLSATIALSRTSPHNEPYKEAARWIRKHTECEGAFIPVISIGNPDPNERAFRRAIEESNYHYYLGTFARPMNVFSADLDSGRVGEALRTEFVERAHGHGCPVIAWVSHGASEKTAPQLAVSIARVAGVKTASIRIHRERAVVTGLHSFAILDKPFAPNSADMISSFVFYSPGTKYVMEPPSEK